MDMKKITCLLLVIICLSMSIISPVSAAGIGTTVEPMASSYFAVHSVSLQKTSSTSFRVWFDVTAVGMMDELGVSEIEVQRSSDGVTWTKMRRYFPSHYSQMICENTCSHVDYVEYNDGIQSYYYRAYITLYAKNSSGSATRYRYTEVIRL